MRYFLGFVAVLATLVVAVASASMNWLFLSGMGKTTLEGQILGAVSVAFDIFKGVLPFGIAAGAAAGLWWRASLASLGFVALVGFSLLSAMGFAASNRSAVTGGREAMNLQLTAAERDLSQLETKIATIQAHRAASVVEADMKRLSQSRRWRSTKRCTDATASKSRKFCDGYFTLERELAASVEATRLETKRQSLKRERLQLRARGAGQDADVQAGFIARLIPSVDVSGAQMAFMVFIAVIVEFISAFGLYVCGGFFAKPKQKRPRGEVVEAHREPLHDVTPPAIDFEERRQRRAKPAKPEKRDEPATALVRGMIGANGELLIEG